MDYIYIQRVADPLKFVRFRKHGSLTYVGYRLLKTKRRRLSEPLSSPIESDLCRAFRYMWSWMKQQNGCNVKFADFRFTSTELILWTGNYTFAFIACMSTEK